jgi:hypothetical protein
VVAAVREDECDLEREKHLILSSHETLDKRGQIFDPDEPEAVLNLPRVPELNIDDEFDVETIGDGIVHFARADDIEERENHGFTFELSTDLAAPSDVESDRRDRDDSVLEILEPVVFGVLRTFKGELS